MSQWLLILEIIIEVGLTCLMPVTRAYFFDHLTSISTAYIGLGLFLGNQFGYDMCQALKGFLVTLVGTKWRVNHTHSLDMVKLANNEVLDNIPQRVQEDIKLYLLTGLSIHVEYLISALIVVYLIIGNRHQLPLLEASVAYSILCIGLAWLFKGKMVDTEKQVQKHEANFRIMVWRDLANMLNKANVATINSAKVRLYYSILNRSQTAIMAVIPYVVLLPLYLSHKVSLGYMLGTAVTFEILVVNMIVLVQLFPQYAQTRASKVRVLELSKGN